MEWRKIFVSYVAIDENGETHYGNAGIAIDGLVTDYEHIKSLQFRLAEAARANGPISGLVILNWREFEGAADGDTSEDGE